MYTSISISPDGNYVMITKINRPFSYLVTYRSFPTSVDVYSKDAKLISGKNLNFNQEIWSDGLLSKHNLIVNISIYLIDTNLIQ